jgi:hypothetical protein
MAMFAVSTCCTHRRTCYRPKLKACVVLFFPLGRQCNRQHRRQVAVLEPGCDQLLTVSTEHDGAGPLLFKSTDAPLYRQGLKAVLGIFVASGGATA